MKPEQIIIEICQANLAKQPYDFAWCGAGVPIEGFGACWAGLWWERADGPLFWTLTGLSFQSNKDVGLYPTAIELFQVSNEKLNALVRDIISHSFCES